MKSDTFDKIPEYDLRNKQDPCENEIGYSPKLEGEDSDYYGFRKLSGKETLYDVGFTLIGVQGGRYHGAVTEITENEIFVVTKDEKDEEGEYITEPMDVNTLILGDYITYIGTESSTDLVEGGSLTTSTLYEWVGKSSDRLYMWKQDVMSEHCGGSLSDALAVSNESLAQNNSTAFQFLDHLTANSIFVNRLVANDAFIKNLFVKQIELQTEYNSDGTVKQYGAIYGGNRYNADGTIKEGSTEETEGFHISSSGLIQANNGKFSGKILTNDINIENVNEGDVFTSHFCPSYSKGQTIHVPTLLYRNTVDYRIYITRFLPKGKYKLSKVGFYCYVYNLLESEQEYLRTEGRKIHICLYKQDLKYGSFNYVKEINSKYTSSKVFYLTLRLTEVQNSNNGTWCILKTDDMLNDEIIECEEDYYLRAESYVSTRPTDSYPSIYVEIDGYLKMIEEIIFYQILFQIPVTIIFSLI